MRETGDIPERNILQCEDAGGNNEVIFFCFTVFQYFGIHNSKIGLNIILTEMHD